MDTSHIIKAYRTQAGECPFRTWYWSLKGQEILQATVDARIDRLRIGHVGDCKSVGDGVYELRIHLGPGYRVYFGYDGDTVVLLLTGSDKSRQQTTIRKARKYLEEYRKRD
jgi:putative addiction module killer protein